MQGDIFQLDQLATRAFNPIAPTGQPQRRKVVDQPQVAIYNEDDLSHLLFVDHHHHHHHQDDGNVNPSAHFAGNDAEPQMIFWSDSDSCSEFDTQSPPTPLTPVCEEAALDAYRAKGRRNAVAVAFEDGFEFPVFLGRQAEEWPCSLPRQMHNPLPSAPVTTTPPVTTAPVQMSTVAPVDDISGPMMSWWPTPLELDDNTWSSERAEWENEHELSNQQAPQTDMGNMQHGTSGKRNYVTPVDSIEGPMMTWWPSSPDMMEHEWNERFYE
ncbi:hypothetical protein F5Y18DRAFT_248356 [Xylariaceae sp. FL1019]|nr:hypothetical protein F5Y18DRAFT_248356 [Xylariaceae sp. FL1019]